MQYAIEFTPLAEKAELVAKCDHLARLKFAKALPFAFTEHGAIMAASVLNSPRAIEASVTVVRAFVALRRAVASHTTLSRRQDELERKHAGHDDKFRIVFETIRELRKPPAKPRRKIGF